MSGGDSCVYVADKEYGWLPATVVSQTPKEAVVQLLEVDGKTKRVGNGSQRTEKLSKYDNGSLPLQNVDAGGNLMEMPDMVDLPSLHEAAILYNLRARHLDSKPYTRVGDLIIAVNPFRWLSHLYSEENREVYVEQLIYGSSGGGVDVRAMLPPHVYETSCLAYRGLAMDGQHQSILVSGESGAGKTETVKIVMSHLASVTSSSDTNDDGTTSLVVQRVLDCHPLLEAFGNAKTVRNDNSSRFGKFIQMQFDVEDAHQAQLSGKVVPNCVLAGSTCETYLLEKSRVVSHEANERTYHIFYQLLATSDELKRKFDCDYLIGKTVSDFGFMIPEGAGAAADTQLMIEGKTDAQRFDVTLNALRLLGMEGDKLKTLFGALMVVMQLANLVVEAEPDDSDKSRISTSNPALRDLAKLMGIIDGGNQSDESLKRLEKSFTFRTVTAGRETFSSPLRPDLARDAIQGFAKEIYQQIFDWLVRNINRETCAESNYEAAKEVDEYGLIGLLDIFGFESFQVNRFEQLCINYTNEKLQQKYTLDIFRSVQEEYSQEGIALGDIPFQDNAEVLHLLEGKIGVLGVLNEECVRPKGNDVAFVSKVKSVNKESSFLIAEKLHRPTEFGILHYAGKVKYDATNFVQKNTDALPKDLIDAACLSRNELIRVELKAAADAKLTSTKSTSKRQLMTVATKFKAQLTQLMHDIAQTKTRYIRCIKPNPEKQPLRMNMLSSAEQLRCAGVVAAVTISRVAFPNRLMHETALERFSCLSHMDLARVADEKKEETENDETGYRDQVSNMLSTLLIPMQKVAKDGSVVKAFECGKSRVYFRTGALEYLEAERLKALGVFAVAIERIARGFTARSKYEKLREAAIDSQACARRTMIRKRFLVSKKACIYIESWVRGVYAKRELVRRQRERASVVIQSRWRSVMAVVALKSCVDAATLIQKIIRGAIQRPKYRQTLKEAEEEARVNSKLAALQKRLKDAEMRAIQADKARMEAEKRANSSTSRASTPTTITVTDDEDEKKVDGEQQKALIEESEEMLEYFRKEVFKLKSANYLLRADLDHWKHDHQELFLHCQSVESSNSALKTNMQKMSKNNMRLALEATTQKDAASEMRQELKMLRIKAAGDMKRKTEEIVTKEKQHEVEVTSLKREIEGLRKVIAKMAKDGGTASSLTLAQARMNRSRPGGASSARLMRANFQERARAAPILGGRKDATLTRTSSFGSREEDEEEEEKWGHDGYFEKMKNKDSPGEKPSGSRRNRRRPRRRNNNSNKAGALDATAAPFDPQNARFDSRREPAGERGNRRPSKKGPSNQGPAPATNNPNRRRGPPRQNSSRSAGAGSGVGGVGSPPPRRRKNSEGGPPPPKQSSLALAAKSVPKS